jgi:aspartyl-tRNA(Asn)/glutamyl-tRNA(Gln) amidotransferase subunit B
LDIGGTLKQQPRLYDSDKNETRSMRSKEDANDYRYFPDPDLLPVVITSEFIAEIKNNLPELPDQKRERFKKSYAISDYEAVILSSSKEMADYYEQATKLADPKLSANWIIGELSAYLNKHNLEIHQSSINPTLLSGLLNRISDNTVSNNIAKKIFEKMWETQKTADEIIDSEGLKQVSDTGEIIKVIEKIMKNNPSQLAEYRSGKDKLFGFFVGQVMKAMGGKANPAQLNELLKKHLV